MEHLLGATVKKNTDSALFRNLSSNPRMDIFGMKDIFARIMLEGKKMDFFLSEGGRHLQERLLLSVFGTSVGWPV